MSNNKYKVLIIEDDAVTRGSVSSLLLSSGYQVLEAENATLGKMLLSSHLPDLLILDLGLPDADGNDLIGFVRKKSAMPIVVLSSRTGEADKIRALDLGANDYVTKPYSPGEFMARIRASLRSGRRNAQEDELPGGSFTLRDLSIDYGRRRVTVGGRDIRLTQTEYNILSLLSEHAGKVLTYTTIIRAIWGVIDSGSTKKLQVNMVNIRKKCGKSPENEEYIINQPGVGYCMASDTEF